MRSRFIDDDRTAGNQCANVVFNPSSGPTPLTVGLSTSTAGAHIFYTATVDGVDPTHNGDNATGITIRIGNNSGSTSVRGDAELRALAYKSGNSDSNITVGDYFIP